jgi:hypothetical protein
VWFRVRRRLVNKLGVSTRTTHTAAIHQHLLEMPAPVVATPSAIIL